jgi:hypothetical protein
MMRIEIPSPAQFGWLVLWGAEHNAITKENRVPNLLRPDAR